VSSQKALSEMLASGIIVLVVAAVVVVVVVAVVIVVVVVVVVGTVVVVVDLVVVVVAVVDVAPPAARPGTECTLVVSTLPSASGVPLSSTPSWLRLRRVSTVVELEVVVTVTVAVRFLLFRLRGRTTSLAELVPDAADSSTVSP